MSKKNPSAPILQELRGVEAQGVVDAFEDTEEHGPRARIRIIKAGVSKNNRNYRKTALQKAAQEGIFNDLKMFVGHSKDVPLKRDFGAFVSYTDGVEYVEATESLEGWANFVDRPFFEKAKAAKHHVGVSIDSQLSGVVSPSTSGGRRYEDIYAFTQPRSVDWVMFPSAGGQVLAWESEEGENDVIDWAAVEAEAANLSEEDLKKNTPSLWAKFHPTTGAAALPAHGNAPESGAVKEDLMVRKEDVEEIVNQRLTAYQTEQKTIADRQEEAAKLVQAAFASSGLPDPVQKRVIRGFESVEKFDEKAVQQAIDDAKEELKLLKVGPKITNMGTGSAQESEGDQKPEYSMHNSVVAAFSGPNPQKPASGDASKGEGK